MAVRAEDRIAQFSKSLPDKGVILDMGCGNCWASRYLLKWSNNLLAVGIDIDLEALKKGKEESSNIAYVCADMIALPFRPLVFDGAMIIMTLHHLKSTQEIIRALCELSRCLKYGGIVLIHETTGDNPVEALARKIFFHLPKLIQMRIAKEQLEAYHPAAIIPLRYSILVKALKSLEFDVMESISFGGLFKAPAEMVMRFMRVPSIFIAKALSLDRVLTRYFKGLRSGISLIITKRD